MDDIDNLVMTLKWVRRPRPGPDPVDSQQVLSFVGVAQVETHVWDDQDRQGWFEARVHGRNLNTRDFACVPTYNCSVQYNKSLTVGVKKEKTIPLGDVVHELTRRTCGEKKWWECDCEGSVRIQSEGDLLYYY